jgi:voltage-gated potassium channel
MMKRLKVLGKILVRTNTHKILIAYLIFVLISGVVVLLVEPDIKNYGDALWYLYAVISTAGFGDIVVSTLLAKIVSLLVTIYSTLVIAIVTGVVVNFYTEITDLSKKETLTAFVNRLEHLDTMSKEELKEMSQQVKKFKSNMKK